MFRLRWLTILVGILFAAILSTPTITVTARFSEESKSVMVQTDDYPDPGADPAHTPPPAPGSRKVTTLGSGNK
ncbi:hypothetical protein M5K25_018953 [Dendrobium thyrsiflorum]|uniref:Uncharacterized protein n=1 Tax=Dendrobium thyrsiflorum TaxID=117978 RepID=A0ABD0UKD8_DENTH